MWLYYKAHRDELIVDVRLYREQILAALRVGVSMEEAFAPYVRSDRVVAVAAANGRSTECKVSQLGKVATAGKAGQAAWPWKAQGAAVAYRASGQAAQMPSTRRYQGASRADSTASSRGSTAGGRA
jgi:hypothetical protein